MKRILSAILILVIIIPFASCGSKKSFFVGKWVAEYQAGSMTYELKSDGTVLFSCTDLDIKNLKGTWKCDGEVRVVVNLLYDSTDYELEGRLIYKDGSTWGGESKNVDSIKELNEVLSSNPGYVCGLWMDAPPSRTSIFYKK